MPTKTIPLTAVSIQSAKPTTRFGQPAVLPLSSAHYVLLRGAFTGIPAGATILSAILDVQSRNNPSWAGARTIKLRTLTSPFSTASTWNTPRPVIPASEVTMSKTGAVFGTHWQPDLKDMVQAWVSGTVANNGVILFSAETPANAGSFQGQTASWGAPRLIVNYVTSAQAPSGLHPASGAVSLAKPTLQFETSADTTKIQVQVDAAADAVTPDYDSGEVDSTAGLLSLARTDLPGGVYPGLADGASTQWRARVRTSFGLGPWSSWVTFSRKAWKVGAVTSPGAVSEDPSPVITATYAGVITAWRALLRNATEAVVEDSGWTPGNTPAFGTTVSVGAAGTAEVQLRDDQVRDGTPGDPDYLSVAVSFTVTPSAVPAPLTAPAVSQDGVSPVVVFEADRAGGVPDEVAVYRNSQLVLRSPGADVFAGTHMTVHDRTAPMNVPAYYEAYAIVNGQWSALTAPVFITPKCTGIWVLDTDDTDLSALILGDEDLEQDQPEVSIVHRPITGPDGEPQVIRRRLSRYPDEGTLAGTLVDALGVDAADSEAALLAWIENDAGHKYRLVLGNRNHLVVLGDIKLSEVARNGPGERIVDVSAGWWSQPR